MGRVGRRRRSGGRGAPGRWGAGWSLGRGLVAMARSGRRWRPAKGWGSAKVGIRTAPVRTACGRPPRLSAPGHCESRSGMCTPLGARGTGRPRPRPARQRSPTGCAPPLRGTRPVAVARAGRRGAPRRCGAAGPCGAAGRGGDAWSPWRGPVAVTCQVAVVVGRTLPQPRRIGTRVRAACRGFGGAFLAAAGYARRVPGCRRGGEVLGPALAHRYARVRRPSGARSPGVGSVGSSSPWPVTPVARSPGRGPSRSPRSVGPGAGRRRRVPRAPPRRTAGPCPASGWTGP